MPLIISRNDIRSTCSDALICPTDGHFSHGGGVDRIVHDLAGKRLDEKCDALMPLEEGQAVLTDAYDFDSYRYIIHTRGPIYIDGLQNEEDLLRTCYRSCLSLAKELSLGSVTFPLISAGTFGFPKGEALRIATEEISSFLETEDMDIEVLIYDKSELNTNAELFHDIKNYISAYVSRLPAREAGPFGGLTSIQRKEKKTSFKKKVGNIVSPLFEHEDDEEEPDILGSADIEEKEEIEADIFPFEKVVYNESPDYSASYERRSFEPDQSFGEYLITLIDERGYKDSDVYKRANVNRDVFNKIINNKVKTPKKKTCVALAISLKLDLKETNELLSKAGYILSSSYVFDQIIIYCLRNKVYNIYEINQVLLDNDQETMC